MSKKDQSQAESNTANNAGGQLMQQQKGSPKQKNEEEGSIGTQQMPETNKVDDFKLVGRLGKNNNFK